MVGVYVICSTGGQHFYTSVYIQLPTLSWVNTPHGWRFGDRDPACAIDTCEGTYHPTRGVTHPAATPPYCVNYICLGKPTLLPRVQGIDGVWELGKTLFERPSGPLLEWGFSAMAETLLLLCCMSGSERWKAFCAPPGNSFSFANSAIAMRPCFILFNAVTMVTAIVFNHHPSLAERDESGGAVAGFPKPPCYTR